MKKTLLTLLGAISLHSATVTAEPELLDSVAAIVDNQIILALQGLAA